MEKRKMKKNIHNSRRSISRTFSLLFTAELTSPALKSEKNGERSRLKTLLQINVYTAFSASTIQQHRGWAGIIKYMETCRRQVNKVSIIKREIFSFNGSFLLLSLAISSAFLPLWSGKDNSAADSPPAIELWRQSHTIMNSIGRLFCAVLLSSRPKKKKEKWATVKIEMCYRVRIPFQISPLSDMCTSVNTHIASLIGQKASSEAPIVMCVYSNLKRQNRRGKKKLK